MRNVALSAFIGGWLIALIIIAARTGTVPAELLVALPAGITGLIVAFQSADAPHNQTPPPTKPPTPDPEGK